MDLPIKIKLKHPVQFGSETISEMNITRAMTAGDISEIKITKIEEITTGEVLAAVGKLAGHSRAVMDRIDPRDLGQIFEVFTSFF